MKREYCIEFSDCSFIPELSLSRITEFVEDAVSSLTLELGCDNITIKEKYKLMWVFTKEKVVINKLPKWKEKIIINCNIYKTEKIKNYFLIEIKDELENVLASIVLEACVISIENYRITKLEKIGLEPKNTELEVNLCLDEPERKSKCGNVQVETTMIDYSNHLNNTKSVTMFLNTLSFDEYKTMISSPYEFFIQYCSQAKYKDNMTIYKDCINNGYFFELESNNKPIVKANLIKK